MLVHRIAKDQYINDLSGEGARLWGGRWNRPGTALLYTSEHRSLALLELLVHFNSKSAFKQAYSFISLKLPNKPLTEIKLSELPENFLEVNNPILWDLTEKYFYEHNVLAIKVPSVIIKNEFNILLNPQHPNFKQVEKVNIESVFLDERFKTLI